MFVDIRWIIVTVVLVGTALLCHRYPQLTVPLTLGLAAAGFAVLVLFQIAGA